MRKNKKGYLIFILTLTLLITGCGLNTESGKTTGASESTINSEAQDTQDVIETDTYAESTDVPDAELSEINLGDIPAFSGTPYAVLNDNVPAFSESDMTTTSFESYSDLDILGRCGTAFANIGMDLMPTEERGAIGHIKPTGWHTVKYDRCHLIGFQLTAENDNNLNLITGTRYFNVEGMLPFENMVADYIKETGNHVLYRVTPIYEGNNLVADGVQMEALSVEDNGDGVMFNIFCYNVQPGVIIDYATGESWLDDNGSVVESTDAENTVESQYILNTNSKKFHLPECSSVGDMSEKNKAVFTGSRQELIDQGYAPCKNCNP